MFRHILYYVTSVFLLLHPYVCYSTDYKPDKETEKRIEALLGKMTFGYSRDDIASFLPVYLEKKILKVDPFQVLDQNGVGQLVRMATEKGRAIRPDLKCGICGEHGGEPSSVKFCHKVGLNYVSCSPFRVPIARLAAAQAAIEDLK